MSELFRLFGAKHKNYDILTASEEGYYRFSVYRQNIYDTANSFSFGMEYTGDTLLTIGKGFLYLHNADAVLDYGRIVAYSFRQNVYSIVTLEEGYAQAVRNFIDRRQRRNKPAGRFIL